MESCDPYFEILELPRGAGLEEVNRSYNYLKKLYAGDAIEVAALNSDFSEEFSRDYLARLDEAYVKVREELENRKSAASQQKTVMGDELRQWVKGIDSFNGDQLREIRVKLGVNLEDIHAVTRIQTEYLASIENESFSSFRAEAYLRSYLIEYARFLGLDSNRVLADYLPRYRTWAATDKKPDVVEVGYVLTKSI